jgi:hypothetical protein
VNNLFSQGSLVGNDGRAEWGGKTEKESLWNEFALGKVKKVFRQNGSPRLQSVRIATGNILFFLILHERD